MVKFGKYLRSQEEPEWVRDYIDYKALKQFIRDLKEYILKEDNKEKNLEFGTYEEVKIKSPGSSEFSRKLIKDDMGISERIMQDYLNRFCRLLDGEIKKVYLFFVNKERELYVLINSHLHIRQSYETFDLKSILKECQELLKISTITCDITKFIDLNMTAVKKILKKFDKNFGSILKRLSLKYIQNKLESKNSDLLYILQFKIIDEVNALLEDLMCDLRTKYNSKKQPKGKSVQPINEDKVEPFMPNEDFAMTDRDLRVNINRFILELDRNINSIDEHHQNFRNNFKEWSHFLKQNTQAYNNVFSVTNNTSLCGLTMKEHSHLGYEHISTEKRNDNMRLIRPSLDTELILSEENNSNVQLTLFHTFFFMFCYSIVLPTNIFYVKELGYKEMLSGLVMAFTPIGTLVSFSYTERWIKKSFKQPMIFAAICLIIGNLLYSIANVCESIVPMIIGRFILGMGSNRVANRGYLIQFVPKAKLTKYLLYFQLCSLLGLATGPLMCIPLSYFQNFLIDENTVFNDMTNPGWFSLIFSIVFLILVTLQYHESVQSNFIMYKEDNQMISDRSSSFAREEVMSKEEKIMIEEIDDKLSEINDKNQFSDTNLVAKSIEQIAWREKKTTSYLYKCFFVFLSVLFVCRLTSESLLIISPYYLNDLEPDFGKIEISMLISGALFLVIPVGLLFNKYLTFTVRDRKMLIYLILTCIVFNILIVNTFYTSLIQYCIVFVFLIVFSNLLENVATTMFSKIIPSDYEIWAQNAGFIIQVFTTLSKITGSLMLSIAGIATDENLNRITYGITLGLFVLALFLTIVFYSHLRVKAIARILRVRTVRKLKNSEI